ncbi:MAG: response regulator transcription factor, partial [Adlercreutzia equolifaciens]
RVEAAEGASANARREALPVAVGEDEAPAAVSETAASLPCRSERSVAGAESKDRPADGESTGEHSCGERPDPYTAFCAEYDLSPRESEVFRLWVTGHGLKYIQNALFVSESTVKSHLRSIYRKCDTHNRDEIIALFEREAPELA